jgi:MYXO-CTERM domain-containing protein
MNSFNGTEFITDRIIGTISSPTFTNNIQGDQYIMLPTESMVVYAIGDVDQNLTLTSGYQIVADANGLHVEQVPEPGWWLGVIIIALLLGRRRRKGR